MKLRGRRTSALAVLLLFVAGPQVAGCNERPPDEPSTEEVGTPAQGEETRSVKQATAVIEELRQGKEYRSGADAFVSAGAVDANALGALAQALRETSEPEREQLVRLLVAIGEQADPLHAKGIPILRDRQVIALLVREGLRVAGSGRDYALDSMEERVPRELLAEHGDALADDLARRPGGSALLLVAKAKPARAASVVRELIDSSPSWADKEEAMIAQAALGDTTIETRFVTSFLATRDPQEKAALAKVLGRIGTPAALKALASEMRTDLITEIPNVLERSVRLDVLAALAHVYPDQTFLYDNAIQDDEGYARVEEFLTRTLGVQWKAPRPPFLTVRGYPTPD